MEETWEHAVGLAENRRESFGEIGQERVEGSSVENAVLHPFA